MSKIVTMGEIMLRLSTPGYERFVQADSFDVCYGGGEANVAVSLAGYGHDASFVTKLPSHEIGEAALCALRREGVDCIDILSGGEIDEEKAYQVARLVLMRSKVIRNVPLKEEELREAKELLRGSYGR